ncbi:BlaI/MecI/CopY family transcriptional regulator [Sphingomicrobium lutaoense]|uniref:Putative transcriptional regulator n=1 Tax=Sphingomicrobium lutaoense TaxID=515949 RepID=A0A839Z2B9_9SPHN|nr:BlaI/MecI/CopY family transcriptional regulator [Sphingomicrobium lutaoense]MBB3764187.1 putative transcriptional regulator [Sphingomicrobium lutaoense]
MDKRVSEAEWEIMEALWASPEPLTAADVSVKVPEERQWSLATVKTMLSRLAAKGAVTHRRQGRRYLYSAAVDRAAAVGHESRRLVDRMFGGRLSPMVARLAEDDALSPEDVEEIEQLLKELRK